MVDTTVRKDSNTTECSNFASIDRDRAIASTSLQWQRRQQPQRRKKRTDPSFPVNRSSTTNKLKITRDWYFKQHYPFPTLPKKVFNHPFIKIVLKYNGCLLSYITCWVVLVDLFLDAMTSLATSPVSHKQFQMITWYLWTLLKCSLIDLFRHILHKIFWVPILKLI